MHENYSSLKAPAVLSNGGMLLLCAVFSLESALGSSDWYWDSLTVCGAVAAVLVVAGIVSAYRRKMSVQEFFGRGYSLSLLYLTVFACGIVLSIAYQSGMVSFWLFMLALEAAHICMSRFRKA